MMDIKGSLPARSRYRILVQDLARRQTLASVILIGGQHKINRLVTTTYWFRCAA